MTVSVQAYKAMVGSELGVSRWFEVDQKRIDTFAECTEDFQFIHVDPERAAETPFGGTIAHGFLTLSLLSAMAYELFPDLEGRKMGVNYGMNKLRFLAPVRSGKRVRGRMTLLDVTERNPGVLQSTYKVVVEIEGEEKPALLAEWVGLTYV
jgi:acyl dehydratase